MSVTVELDYQPLPTQARFHASPAKLRAFIGGLGSGKTRAGAYEMLHLALEYPGSLGLIARQTYRELEDTTKRTFLEIVPDILIQDLSRSDNRLTLRNGSEIIFRSLDDPDNKLKSLNLGTFWIDEASEVSEAAYLTAVGRLRQETGPRRGLITTNPNGRDWVWRRFVAKPDPDSAWFHAPTESNTYLPPDYIEQLRASYPEQWVKRYVLATFDTMEGMVWPEFDERIHLVEPFPVPPTWPVYLGIDVGYTNPTAVLWATVDDQGDIYIVAEHYQSGWRVPEHVAAINQLSELLSLKPIKALIDPSARSAHKGERSYLDEYRDAGLNVVAANNDVRAGIERVGQLLHHAHTGDHPGLYIFRGRCPHLVDEIRGYVWDIAPDHDASGKERPKKVADHAADSLRYLAMDRPAPRLLPSYQPEIAYDSLTGEPLY